MTQPNQETSPEAASSKLVAACRLRNDGLPPFWIMRQAGRYLPEYRELRERHSFVTMCQRPDLASEVTLMPYRRFAMDGVVVFYDILFIAEAMGAPLEFTEDGPRFLKPLAGEEDLRALREPDPWDLDPKRGTGAICETIRRVRSELPPTAAVLGFAGAPFTLAAYLVEGSFRKSGDGIRRLMYGDPAFLHRLLETLAEATSRYLVAQAEAGAGAVQLFDTWAGILGPQEFREFAVPYAAQSLRAVAERGTPTILYINGCGHLLDALADSGASVLSVDWRVPLVEVRRRLGPGIALQGNLDPAALYQSPDGVRRSVRALLDGMADDPGYIFNLGHGILPDTPVESVEALVETVRGAAAP